MKSILALALLSFSSLLADENRNSPAPGRLTVRHIESGGIDYNNGYTTSRDRSGHSCP